MKTSKIKRLVILLLFVTFSVLIASAYSFAVDGVYYQIEETSGSKEVSVTYSFQYSRNYKGNVVIPQTVKYNNVTYTVTAIGFMAFYCCDKLTSLTIPSTINTIHSLSFDGCTSLSAINISDIAAWCDVVFEGNHSNPLGYAHRLYLNNQEIINLQIPNTVKSIGASKFYKLANLKSVTIPESVVSIGANAFYGCTGLTSLIIPKNVSYIGYGAFNGCSSLNSVYFNAEECDNFNYKTPPYTGDDFNPPFYNCPINNLIIGTSVKKIPSRLAWQLKTIKSVNIPNSVDTIMGRAFDGCSGLTEVIIPNSVSVIGAYAFSGCSGLTKLTLPNSVISVGMGAFINCSGLTNARIGDNIKIIEDDLLGNCSALNNVTIGKSVKRIGARAFRGCSSLIMIQIPDSVTIISENAFLDCISLTSLTIGKSVKSIDRTSFKGCINVKTLNFSAIECNDFTMSSSNNVYPPFYNMPLESIILGNGVKKIPAYFATGQASFSQINIPSSVTNIGNYAFSACTGLNKVKITDVLAWVRITFVNEDANPLKYAGHLYLNGNELSNLVLPESVNEIKKYAFYGCKSLECVTIPQSVNTIGDYSFSRCANLSKVVVLNIVPPTLKSDVVFPQNQLIYVPKVSNYSVYHWKNVYNIQGFYTVTPMVTKALVEANDVFKVLKVNLLDNNGTVSKSFSAINNVVEISNLEPNTTSHVVVETSYDQTEISVDDEITTKLTINEFKISSTQTSLSSTFMLSRDSGFWIDGCGVECNSKDYNGEIKEMTFDNYTISCKITGLSPNTNYSLRPWVEFNGVKYYGDYTSRKTSSIGVTRKGNVGPTSVNYTGTYNAGDAHVTDAYFTFQGENSNKLFKTGLEPLTQYSYYYTVKTTNGDQSDSYSFKTTALSMAALTARMLTNTTAMLIAETNMADEETSCGFEWRRYDAPAEMPSTKVYCPVYGGTMAGTLKNLSENVYYKYRPFYKSRAGNEYYGDWIAFITADAGVVFEPVVYTYSSPEVSQTEATLQGVALRGSDEITEQGFEYWQAGQNNMLTGSSVKKVTAQGERMSATVTGLQPGTVYKFRAYAIAGGKTTRGAEVDFVTESTGLDVNADGIVNIADMNVIINVILRGNNDKTCDVNGDGVVNISDLNTIISAILAN